MKDCIQDFVAAWKQYDKDNRRIYIPPWPQRFDDAGYYGAVWGGGDWNEVQQWCQSQFGPRHYAWVGEKFWFETEQDAVLFILRWS